MPFTAKPAAEKLPLAARKSIRDNFETKRPGFEEKISAILGEKWTVEVNANEIFPYVASGSREADNLGSAFAGYFEPLIPNLEEFVKKYGDDGKGELNSVASAHKVVVAVDDTENHRYCGSDIKDGALRLLFHVEQFGQYPSDASTDIIGALKAAPAPKGAFSLITRNGIKTDYEANVEEVRAALAEIVAVPELKLTPNFEFNHGVLSEMGTQAPSNWETKLGYATLEYFKGVKESLKKQKFDSDDMLQEGFQESISKNEITLRIVEPLDCGGSYNEVVIKDGVLIVQTLPGQWGSWTGEAADKLTSLL